MTQTPFHKNCSGIVAFNIQLSDVVMTRAQSKKLQDDLSRALKLALAEYLFSDAPPLPKCDHKSLRTVGVIAAGSVVCGMCFVSDLQHDLAAVQTELKRANLFAGSEIGWWSPFIDDSTEKRWHRYPEEIPAAPFVPKILAGKEELVAIAKELEAINPRFAWLATHPRPTLAQLICRFLMKILLAVLWIFIAVNTKVLQTLKWIGRRLPPQTL